MLLILALLVSASGCIWYTPAVLFPTDLVHLESDHFHQRRFSTVPANVPILSSDTHILVHNGGLDTQGSVQYSVIFDASVAVKDMEYRVESITPLNVTTYTLSGTTTLVKIDHTLADALTFQEMLVVTVSAWSPCLPNRALSEFTYKFNVTASYEIFYDENNTLAPKGGATLVSIYLPPSNKTHKWVETPCLNSYIQSSLQVFNTSQYTHWINERQTRQHMYLLPDKDMHSKLYQIGGGIQRCHFKGYGSVCTVVAQARFEYGQVCSRPVTFSLWQTVSQISRQQATLNISNKRPIDFDATHRLPVPDGLDMRYDMCEARICSNDGCTPIDIRNDEYALAGHIELDQTLLARRGVLETECRFEVIAFMDDIWSPWLHFRQSVGYTIS